MDEQKKYLLIESDYVKNIQVLFSDSEELLLFCNDLKNFITETLNISADITLKEGNEEASKKAALKIVFVFGILCRKNMEMIREIVKHVNYKLVNEEEMNELIKKEKDDEQNKPESL